MTVMSWGNSEGTKGRCDARCHGAKSVTCACMCGGRYHGAARDGSLGDRVREHGADILKAAERRAAEYGFTVAAADVTGLIGQGGLF